MKTMMKASLMAALVTLAACGSGETNKSNSETRAGTDGAGSSNGASANTSDTHSATGTVDSVSGSEVTISHDPIKTIGWPAMTMPFTAQDAALLNGIKPGDRVSFVFSKTGDASTITSISKQ